MNNKGNELTPKGPKVPLMGPPLPWWQLVQHCT